MKQCNFYDLSFHLQNVTGKLFIGIDFLFINRSRRTKLKFFRGTKILNINIIVLIVDTGHSESKELGPKWQEYKNLQTLVRGLLFKTASKGRKQQDRQRKYIDG